MRYELLEEGQRTKEGDEVFKDGEWLKLKDGAIGFVTFKGYVYRRALPDKPKVRLEELTKVAMDAYSDKEHDNYGQAIEAAVKAICTHLGIEIEEEKPEWERAWEDQYKHRIFCSPEGRDKCKEDFKEGWQACERRKGEK